MSFANPLPLLLLYSAFLLAALPPLPASEATGTLSLNGTSFTHGWNSEPTSTPSKTYYLPGEGSRDWTSKLTLKLYPTQNLIQILDQYSQTHKNLLALPQKTYLNTLVDPTGDPNDNLVELGIGLPNLTANYQFVAARFVLTPKGILALFSSHQMPFEGPPPNHPNLDVNAILQNPRGWRNLLFSLSTSTLLQEIEIQEETPQPETAIGPKTPETPEVPNEGVVPQTLILEVGPKSVVPTPPSQALPPTPNAIIPDPDQPQIIYSIGSLYEPEDALQSAP